MSLAIFVDFGATRVKSVLFDINRSKVICEAQVTSPSVKSHAVDKTKYEIPPEDYWIALEQTVSRLLDNEHRDQKIEGIWLCSEMHGFALADASGQALTPYISWKDERAVNDSIDGLTTLQQLKYKLPRFRDITGMHLKSGLPVVTLASILRSDADVRLQLNLNNKNVLILTLLDWLMLRGGELEPKSDITLLMGLGFHDYESRQPSKEILSAVIADSFEPRFLSVKNKQSDSLGVIKLCGRSFTVYGGLGDFQSAIFGAGYTNDSFAIINMGTGSQVAVPYISSDRKIAEIRVTANDSIAEVITHIPCGRALNVLANFFDQFGATGAVSVFWDAWNRVTASDIASCKLNSNLCFFESAWGKQPNQTSGWIGLAEDLTDLRSVMAGIARAWVKQYCEALSQLDPNRSIKKVILSGGVAHKSKFLLGAFRFLDQERQYIMADSKTGEETMDGLLNFMKLNEGK